MTSTVNVVPSTFCKLPPSFHQGSSSSGEQVLVAVPAGHAPPLLPPFRSELTSRRASLRAKKGANLWVPNLVNMAVGTTPPVLNSGSVPRYDYRHTPVDNKERRFVPLMPTHVTVLSLLVVCLCSR